MGAMPNAAIRGRGLPAEIIKINPNQPEDKLVTYVAERIRAGYVAGMPTDTFYGLAADPLNLRAVDRIYDVKSRSRHKPLSLLIESVDQAEELARPQTELFYLLARKFWPGPLTMIVKASQRLPLKVTANTGNVALSDGSIHQLNDTRIQQTMMSYDPASETDDGNLQFYFP